MKKKAEVESIYRPGDTVIVKMENNVHFVVNSAEVRDGKLWINASPDPDWDWEFPAHYIVCRSNEVIEETEAKAV